METARDWACETFGDAELGDVRRTHRLMTLAEAAAERPAGCVTEVCRDAAEQEGAYRLLESGQLAAEELSRVVAAATARRCASVRQLYVAVDQTGISVVDRLGTKRLGRTRRVDSVRQGLQAMSALAIDPSGAPIGVLGQQWWRRPDERTPDWHHDRRPAEQRESALWNRTLDQCMATLSEHAKRARPWFQLDRGADSNRLLRWAHRHRGQADVTFRSAYERTVKSHKPLRKTLRRHRVAGYLHVHVRASRGRGRQRPARTVRCAVRFEQVVLQSRDCPEAIGVSVVHVREPRQHPRRLEWWLITTKPVRTLQDALAVVRAYTYRWRVEELHYTWKSGACDVESSQLRTAQALQSWATLLGAVAARVERLKHPSRTEPDLPASVELNRHEVDAAIILSRTKKHKVGDKLTIGQAVKLIAGVGGHAGRPSSGPPGSKVLGRGFERVLFAARMAEALRKSG